MRDSAQVKISHCAVTKSSSAGILLSNSLVVIESCVIQGNSTQGIVVAFNSEATLKGNTITENGKAGVEVKGSQAVLERNIVQHNKGCGVKADPDSTVSGRDNSVVYNGGEDLCGVSRAIQEREPPPAPLNLRVTPEDWTNDPITVDWDNPEDVSGIVAYWYKIGAVPRSSNDGIRKEISEKPLTLPKPFEGEQPIYIWLEDGLGNKSHENRAQGTYRFDKTPPRIAYILDPKPNEHGWNNTAVTVRAECQDALSGVASCPEPVTLTEEGVHKITLRARDNAGNTREETVTVRLDRTPPTGSLLINQGASPTAWKGVTLSISAQDEGSGAYQMRLSNDGRSWTEWEPLREKRLWDLTDPAYGGNPDLGTKTVYLQLRDRAGNVSDPIAAQIELVQPKEVRVPEDFPTIAEALEAIVPGDTVSVAPGTYRESLLIRKAVTLKARKPVPVEAPFPPISGSRDSARASLSPINGAMPRWSKTPRTTSPPLPPSSLTTAAG